MLNEMLKQNAARVKNLTGAESGCSSSLACWLDSVLADVLASQYFPQVANTL